MQQVTYRRFAGVLAVAIGLSAAAPSEAPAASRTKRRFAKAVNAAYKLFEASKFDEAVAKFEAAYAIVPKVALRENIARTWLAAKRCDRAIAEVERFEALTGGLPAAKSLPALRADVDGVCRPELSVASEPPGGTVTVDGEEWGPAPVTRRALVGERRVRVVLHGWEPWEAPQEMEVGRGAKVVAKLVVLPEPAGFIEVRALPGTQLWIDGEAAALKGEPPRCERPPGTYVVRALRGAAGPVEVEVEVVDMRTAVADVQRPLADAQAAVDRERAVTEAAEARHELMVVSGLGLAAVGLAAGGVLGLVSRKAAQDETAARGDGETGLADIKALNGRARSTGLWANVSLGIGAAAALGAGALWLWAGPEAADADGDEAGDQAGATWQIVPTAIGAMVIGEWR